MTAVPVTPDDTSFYEAARPFALVAVVAFVVGFLGYVVLGQGAIARPHADTAVIAEPAAAAPASDDWNVPKRI